MKKTPRMEWRATKQTPEIISRVKAATLIKKARKDNLVSKLDKHVYRIGSLLCEHFTIVA